MLDENSGEALERAEHGAMKHYRSDLVRMLVDIERAEPGGHVEVHLDRAALPVASDSITQNIFELGSVECAFALVERPWAARCLERGHQSRFRLVPDRVVSDALV